jgi:hypothetical protein
MAEDRVSAAGDNRIHQYGVIDKEHLIAEIVQAEGRGSWFPLRRDNVVLLLADQ